MMAGNKLFYKKKKSMALLLIDLGISIFSNGNFPENLVVKIMAQSSPQSTVQLYKRGN